MNCPNCGKSLQLGSLVWCPFCGANISALQTKSNKDNIAHPPVPSADPQSVLMGAFKAIFQRFGPDAMNDGRFIMTNISQMGPDVAHFAPLVDAFLRCGGNIELMAVREAMPKARAKAVTIVTDRMTTIQVHEADASFICSCFCDAVAPMPTSTTASTGAPKAKKLKSSPDDKPHRKNVKKVFFVLIALILITVLITGSMYLVPKLINNGNDEQERTSAENKHSEAGNSSENSNGKDDKDGLSKEDGTGSADGTSTDEGKTETTEDGPIYPAEDESVATAPSIEESTTPQEEIAQAPEIPSEQMPDESQPNGIVISNEYYFVTLPDSWDGLYCDEHRDNGRISFYEVNAYEAGSGGHIFSITLQDSDYTYHPAFQILGKLTAQDGKVYDVVALFPTDVQAVEGHFEEYSNLYEQADTILDSLTPQPGCSFEPKSTTSVLSTYINTMVFIEKEGKLWLHEDTSHNGGNNTLDDYSAPGYIERPVRDNHGNTYTYGLHLDGYGANMFYVTYELYGVYSTFSGTCILPDAMIGTGDSKYFQIYCDDALVFTSETMKDGCAPQDFAIDVTGVYYLTIVYPPTAGSNETAVLADGLLQ